MNYLSNQEIRRITETHSEEIALALSSVRDNAIRNGISEDILDVVFSPAYANEIIDFMIMSMAVFENDEDLIIRRVTEAMQRNFNAEINFLHTYQHPRIYISENECPALAKFKTAIYTEHEAKAIYDANRQKWEKDILFIYSPIAETIPKYSRNILLQELNQCAVYALMYGSKQLHPLENIKRGLEYELKCCIKLNSLDEDITDILDELLA